MNIVLTGFMGTGKTAVGKILARRLEWTFCDTDELIEKEVGLPIKDIFQEKGEPFFRELEHKIVRRVSSKDHWVISTGGGVVLRAENMAALEKNGMVVCLTARPDTILERVAAEGTARPLLNVPDPRKKVETLLSQRDPFYRRCGVRIETDSLSPEAAAEQIIGWMEKK
ncbi:MAG TPA: shikimate kinase [Elusimicrobiota bacterium]|nr:shikimate kinase [Elusimicrobiota bacterium]